jgi:hypothetical protein
LVTGIDRRRSVELLGLAILFQAVGYGQSGPQPPCGRVPVPEWPALGELATVKSWSRADLGRDWKPPACTGWAEPGFTTLVTVAARFRPPPAASGGTDGLLRHIGAISELAGMRYWSTTHKQWLTLITGAGALTDLKSERHREAFTPSEMKPGAALYFEQVDNLTGKGVFQMHVSEVSADRIVFEVQNVTPLKYLFLTVLHPGDMQSIYFLDRESEDVWRFYSIVRTGVNASSLVTANDSSAINRAVAFYRWMVGIPGDQEPPAAR